MKKNAHMSRWNTKEKIATEIVKQIGSAMALSRNIEETHMAVSNIAHRFFLNLAIF